MTTRTKPHFTQSRTCQGWESLLIGTDGQPLLALAAKSLHDLIERQEEVLWLARDEGNFDVTSCGFAVGRIMGKRRNRTNYWNFNSIVVYSIYVRVKEA